MGKIRSIDVSNFSSSLNLRDLIYWINVLNDYFDLEEVRDP